MRIKIRAQMSSPSCHYPRVFMDIESTRRDGQPIAINEAGGMSPQEARKLIVQLEKAIAYCATPVHFETGAFFVGKEFSRD